VIAVDTNVLVYAHRRDSPWHEAAAAAIRSLAEGTGAWALPWPCLHEFLAVVTHPRIYRPPTSGEAAIAQVEAWLDSPSLVIVAESEAYWPMLRQAVLGGQAVGPIVHDARVAALCAAHGVRELWTADRDFGRFPDVTVVNPLVGR
jgi:uncharacterized protein